MPDGSARSSGSRVRLPKSIALLMYIVDSLQLVACRSTELLARYIAQRLLEIFFGYGSRCFLDALRYLLDDIGALHFAELRSLHLGAGILAHRLEEDETEETLVLLEERFERVCGGDRSLKFYPSEVSAVILNTLLTFAKVYGVRELHHGRSAFGDERATRFFYLCTKSGHDFLQLLFFRIWSNVIADFVYAKRDRVNGFVHFCNCLICHMLGHSNIVLSH